MDKGYSIHFPAFDPPLKRRFTTSEDSSIAKRLKTENGHKDLVRTERRKTVPVPFNLRTEERARLSSVEECPRRIFKARPVPRSNKTPNLVVKGVELCSQKNQENEHQRSGSKKLPTGERSALKALSLQHGSERKSSEAFTTSFAGPVQERPKSTHQADLSPFVFKPKPMPDFSNPFIPKPSSFQATKPVEFSLFSNERAAERQEFERQQQEKRLQEEALEAERRQLEIEQQEAELHAYRQSLEFKARPVPSLIPFELKYPAVVLTIPASPCLKTALRASHRSKTADEPVFMDLD